MLSEASVVDETPIRKEPIRTENRTAENRTAEKRAVEKTKSRKKKDSYSEPPPVESMSESEVSQQIVFEEDIPSAEIEIEAKSISLVASKQHKMMESDSEESFSESSKSFFEPVEEELLSEVQDGPVINPGNLVSGGKREDLVITPDYKSFILPSLDLLDEHEEEVAQFDEKELRRLSVLLEERLMDFSVRGEVMAIRPGPVITTFEYKPARGIKISKISGLADDIAMALMAVRVRIVAPIPGRDVVGIEIPNKKRQVIWGLDMLGSEKFQNNDGIIPLVLGKNVEGLPVVSDLAKMPHLLVGGTTGSGKSVGINTMLLSMLYKHTPETLRLILIDPKMLEFEMYHDIPHLIHPVITDSHLASGILKWACDEMDSRYALMAKFKTRTIVSFNKRLEKELQDWTAEKAKKLCGWNGRGEMPVPKKMPYIVVVIDELADLMMVAGKDVESSIIRIAQKARACGIHLIVATQRPSVDVITGMIKANMPCRISFQVRQRTDSRTILDQNGGENLLGRGDMLFLPPGISSLLRCHGPFISDDEVRTVTDFLRAQAKPSYEAKIIEEAPKAVEGEDKDDLFDLAIEYVAEMGKASTSMIQRKFRIGYNRAARLMDLLEESGIIGPADGAKPRKVLVKPIS
jgi:S-DNA-T family DNA segregation ATPase FtsK/SpoIIIE